MIHLTEQDLEKLIEKVQNNISKIINKTGNYVLESKINESLKQTIKTFIKKNNKNE